MTQELTPGEHVDLDSGVIFKRNPGPGMTYTISKARKSGRTDHIKEVPKKEIKAMAELAGYTVSDE